jgi:hypothetical protein
MALLSRGHDENDPRTSCPKYFIDEVTRKILKLQDKRSNQEKASSACHQFLNKMRPRSPTF